MAGHDIVVIGASLGGVQALQQLVGQLPAGLPAAVFIVLHTPPAGPSLLADLLARVSTLPVERAKDLAQIQPGHVYVGVPDRHLGLEPGHLRVHMGPRENRHRPSIDALFRSAALAYRERAVGVVLTGGMDDGVSGLMAIKAWGGVTIVQDPAEALAPDLPRNALERVPIDHLCRLGEIPGLLTELARAQVRPSQPAPARASAPTHEAPSVYGCPTCGGVLWEVDDGSGWLRFHCRVGHGYSPHSLLADQQQTLENSLWSALRALEEMASLQQRVANVEAPEGGESERLRAHADANLARAEQVRQLLGEN